MKYKCKECKWQGETKELLVAENPFDSSAKITGCPICGEVNSVQGICDEPDCWEAITCGFPTRPGYRRTCGEHYRNGET